MESSRRVKKEADLEEVRRVLKQDTTMYEARKSASDRLHEAVRTLEAGEAQAKDVPMLSVHEAGNYCCYDSSTDERHPPRALVYYVVEYFQPCSRSGSRRPGFAVLRERNCPTYASGVWVCAASDDSF